MENFVAYNPVQLHFGKGVVSNLGKTVHEYGNKVLLIYGKGSVKKNSSYNDVVAQLEKYGIEIIEYSGIKSNPVIEDVQNAINLGVEKQVDFVVALGGGSVIDSAKMIALCIPQNLDAWKVMKMRAFPKKSLPLISILTLAATGSEMNMFAVIQNPETGEKMAHKNPLIFPKHSFLDPVYTYSVSPEYTAYGIVDLIAHSFEAFFSAGEADLSDRFVQAIVQEAMRYALPVLKEPDNYDYRANIMWIATNALNGITAHGRAGSGDWGVHAIGHTLSVLYDTPHGASLSIAYPAWLKLMKTRIPDRIKHLAKLIFNINECDDFIVKLETFFRQLKAPVKLTDINIDNSHKQEILNAMIKTKVNGYYHEMNEDDLAKIVDNMY
jgi:alcohol dehydrogenase YqhD (iron-dependent ADH family)